MKTIGPVHMSRNERIQICHEIVDRLHEVYKDNILAIGAYGSVGRGTDGPFSDVEIFCVLHQTAEPVNDVHEWVAGPWKAEVNVISSEILLQDASTVEDDWPLTHGAYLTPLPLYDPEGFFKALREAAESPVDEEFTENINGILVGEMYEFIGKLRNASMSGSYSYLPYLAMEFAQYGAMLVGLHNRKIYTTGATVLPESLLLPQRPAGYDPVARLVMDGDLADPARIISACEAFWNGLVQWADEHGYVIESERIPF